ncbi:MAG: ATP-binding cassette domain-containing protein [Thermodesulfobacteriota bacterium]|nr:ATP-binding cassette domain-containing protein [Thermodesulfobacteriota bacterium]
MPNGAGKSTVINLIMGFIKPEHGSVRINGSLPYNPQARQDIGYLPEDPRFYNNLSAEEFLLFGAHASGMEKAHIGIFGLERAIFAYKGRYGRKPESLHALIGNGIINRLPENPFRDNYLYDVETGRVFFDEIK